MVKLIYEFQRQCQHARLQLLEKRQKLVGIKEEHEQIVFKEEPLDTNFEVYENEDEYSPKRSETPVEPITSNTVNKVKAKRTKERQKKLESTNYDESKLKQKFLQCSICDYTTAYSRSLSRHMGTQ